MNNNEVKELTFYLKSEKDQKCPNIDCRYCTENNNCRLQKALDELLQLKAENEKLEETVKTYKEDRFCQGGCAIYQYDKIRDLTQKLEKAREYFNKIIEDGSGYEYNDTLLAQQALIELNT